MHGCYHRLEHLPQSRHLLNGSRNTFPAMQCTTVRASIDASDVLYPSKDG